MLKPRETPDGRPGASVLLFTMSKKELVKQIQNRVGQCVLTSPTSACFAGLDEGEQIALGKNLRFFGLGLGISAFLIGLLNWAVDPYGIYGVTLEGINTSKYAVRHDKTIGFI